MFVFPEPAQKPNNRDAALRRVVRRGWLREWLSVAIPVTLVFVVVILLLVIGFTAKTYWKTATVTVTSVIGQGDTGSQPVQTRTAVLNLDGLSVLTPTLLPVHSGDRVRIRYCREGRQQFYRAVIESIVP